MALFRTASRKTLTRPGGVARISTAQPSGPDPPAPAKRSESIECLRVHRVARLLDVSPKRVYQLIAEGRLEVIRLGPRQTRVFKRSLERYIETLVIQEMEREI